MYRLNVQVTAHGPPFFVALTAVAILSEICQNWRFLNGWVTLSTNFR